MGPEKPGKHRPAPATCTARHCGPGLSRVAAMGDVTYRDYAWTKKTPDLFYAFCLTYISNATVSDVIAALPTVGRPEECDVRSLISRSVQSWDEIGDDNLLVGVFQHGDWVIMYEHNGYVGASPRLMQPLSAGREVVAHVGSEVSNFFWFLDGMDRTWFETLFASQRQGTAPDDLVPIMRQIGGFELDQNEGPTELHDREATFALCDTLTGLRLTPQLLRAATFTLVEVVTRPGTPAAADRQSPPSAAAEQTQAIRDWARRQGHNLP